MDKTSELDCYLFYMWNGWNPEHSKGLFGEQLGTHIWNKWESCCFSVGHDGAPAAFYSTLDKSARKAIREKAVAYYAK